MTNIQRGATRTPNPPIHTPRSKKPYLLFGCLLALGIGVTTILTNFEQSQPGRSQITLDLNKTPDSNIAEPAAARQDSDSHALPKPAAIAAEQWTDVTVASGDNLSLIFSRAGLSATEVHRFVTGNDDAKLLRNIYPGEILSFQIDNEKKLQKLKYQKNKLETVQFFNVDNSFTSDTITRTPDVIVKQAHATINNSLFLAGIDAGLSQNTIMELANVFGGVMDFALDPRKGDSFTVLYEQLYLDGEPFSTGKILAAQYTNVGEVFQAYYFKDSKGDTGYFNEKGVSMRKAFLRSPVDFTRISSNFNPNRLHPVFKTKRPHRGIDYAAATGTPVYASGAGRVTASGYTKANGNYVVIQHGEAYVTKYLHLNKRNVKKGQRVKQKQIIGTVGSTGYATGPHLHYEFLVNGVHRNPRTIVNKLPKAKSIAKGEMENFTLQTAQIVRQLDMIAAQYHGDTFADRSLDENNTGG
ncbi:Murein DD-endopeptidase MepM [Sinobacterium norvegicum]|uniref:Murein DD-endopeptidase MepM n=1 Tax=Sinobacterium norvegicum TaxID=1641715 RepID=A0ABN8EP83_9GAMM|nr:peptidoglycan DD-metalloendopeptidase family protein [Sinobacterium norvegicum]CAH0992797.1 Murein DD-endopeptidase MepM [Sinobacterium norvegicum]